VHEVGLMTQTLEMAEAIAREQGARNIHRLVLRVGAFSGVDGDALRFAFDAAAAGTLAASAILDIEAIAAVCWCETCQTEFQPPGPYFACPGCGAVSRELRHGNELELATLEVS
jgi:hydrogenase nickel incorporation protein HypA/HybF